MEKITKNIDEAAFYVMFGGCIKEVLVKTLPENKSKKKGFRREAILTITKIPGWCVNMWDTGFVYTSISDFVKWRKRLKTLIKFYL